MKYIKRKNKVDEELNMSPLIDMVFILLIFFVVSTTFVKDMQLDLERPNAKSSSMASTKSLRVYIDRNENVYMNEQSVKSWMLQSRIRNFLRSASSKKILVVSDELVSSKKLIEVVDQCKMGGATEVGVATELN